jgi:hypothetical protein
VLWLIVGTGDYHEPSCSLENHKAANVAACLKFMFVERDGSGRPRDLLILHDRPSIRQKSRAHTRFGNQFRQLFWHIRHVRGRQRQSKLGRFGSPFASERDQR